MKSDNDGKEDTMIYTLTLNPSLDYTAFCSSLAIGKINRSIRETMAAGGKGINVSKILKELGYDSTALGFVAGFTGDEIEKELKERGIRTDFVRLPSGFSRVCVKLRPEDGSGETDVNGAGPEIPKKCVDALFERLSKMTENDFLILAGSVPNSLPRDFYAQILKITGKNRVPFAVDAEGDALLRALPCRPFLIKPNEDELASIFGKKPENDGEILAFARDLQKKGAQNVLVSLGKRGALLVTSDGMTARRNAPPVTAVDTVGAGDSMLAAFLGSYLDAGDFERSLLWGIAAGGATAASPTLAEGERIRELFITLSESNQEKER